MIQVSIKVCSFIFYTSVTYVIHIENLSMLFFTILMILLCKIENNMQFIIGTSTHMSISVYIRVNFPVEFKLAQKYTSS